MTDLSPEGVVVGFFEALAAHDFNRAAGPIAEDCDWQNVASGARFRGPEAIVKGLREFVAAFPDWRVSVDRVTCAGEIVVVEWDTSGTFQQPFRGAKPNGKRFNRQGCAVAEVRGGKIVRYRDFYDRATLLQQLGLLHLLEAG